MTKSNQKWPVLSCITLHQNPTFGLQNTASPCIIEGAWGGGTTTQRRGTHRGKTGRCSMGKTTLLSQHIQVNNSILLGESRSTRIFFLFLASLDHCTPLNTSKMCFSTFWLSASLRALKEVSPKDQRKKRNEWWATAPTPTPVPGIHLAVDPVLHRNESGDVDLCPLQVERWLGLIDGLGEGERDLWKFVQKCSILNFFVSIFFHVEDTRTSKKSERWGKGVFLAHFPAHTAGRKFSLFLTLSFILKKIKQNATPKASAVQTCIATGLICQLCALSLCNNL